MSKWVDEYTSVGALPLRLGFLVFDEVESHSPQHFNVIEQVFRAQVPQIFSNHQLRLDFGKGAEEFKYRMGAKDTYLVGVEAKKGSLRIMSKIASLPGVKGVVERTGAKDSALKKMYERT